MPLLLVLPCVSSLHHWLFKLQKHDGVPVFLCSPVQVWSSMPSKSLLKPSRLCHVRWLRTLVWRGVSSSLNCTLHIMREIKTWASTLRCVRVPEKTCIYLVLKFSVQSRQTHWVHFWMCWVACFCLVLTTDCVDVILSLGRWTCFEGCAWKWYSGALSG